MVRRVDERHRSPVAAGVVAGVHVLDALDALAVRRWSSVAVERLTAHRAEIDALNVFPVPDGDTGSNLLATLRAGDTTLAATLAAGPDTTAAAALTALADGAALGAVGNSGFIVSQLLRGLADAATRASTGCDVEVIAVGLETGADLARSAVVTPVEGTVLTVARAAADAATTQHRAGASLAETITTSVAAADIAVASTTGQLAELTRHGVVDAGGRGLVVLLDALRRVVVGDDSGADLPSPPASGPRSAPVRVIRESGSSEFGFEVQYLLEAPDLAPLRDTLSRLGDSIAVVPAGPGMSKVHVHVNDIGAAIEAGLALGRVHGISVVSFADQRSSVGTAGTAVVAVAPGAGLAHLFEAEGVHALDGSDGVPPSSDDVLAAIRATGAHEVVLLPNASVVTGAAEAAARQARQGGTRVAVVPTRSPVQGLAAIAVHDAQRLFDDDVVAMAEAAAATRVAELTVAGEQALTAVGVCQPGDVLGLIDGEVVEIGRGMLAVAFGLVDRLLGVGAELMTIVVGDGAPRRAGELVEAHIRGRAPLTDVTVYAGGQPDHPVIIGAE